MSLSFHVKGVNPAGRIMEIQLAAADMTEAKRHAESVGLEFVVVTPITAQERTTTEATPEDAPPAPAPEPGAPTQPPLSITIVIPARAALPAALAVAEAAHASPRQPVPAPPHEPIATEPPTAPSPTP